MDTDTLQAVVDRYARGTNTDDDVRALLDEVLRLRDLLALRRLAS